MSTTIHVERSDVEPIIAVTFPFWQGKKVRVRAAESVTLSSLNWSGGSRNQYAGCSLTEGRATGDAAAGNMAPPWDNPFEGKEVTLLPGLALVEHAMFCGKDHGLTIFVHPSMLARYLPTTDPAADLSDIERKVLWCIRTLVSSYRREEAARLGVGPVAYDAVVLCKRCFKEERP